MKTTRLPRPDIMSVTEPNGNAMFTLLDTLPEGVRNVSIGQLTKDDLADIVRTVWRERDAARISRESHRKYDFITVAGRANTDLQQKLTA